MAAHTVVPASGQAPLQVVLPVVPTNGQAPLQAVLPNRNVVVAAPVAAKLASELRYCVQGAQAFFLHLTGWFDTLVWHSHGDHVPLSVRDSATYLWWLPELLCIDYSKFDRGVGATFSALCPKH